MSTVTITGTPTQIAARYTVNGVALTESMISALARMGEAAGFARVVERVKPASGRGKPAAIWEITLPSTWKIQEKKS